MTINKLSNKLDHKMEVRVFIDNYKEAFGKKAELPVVFWYSNTAIADISEKIGGCFFKRFNDLRKGNPLTLTLDNLGCMGGKLYTGFSEMFPKVPEFVSLKERYKKTPEMVVEFIDDLKVPRSEKNFLNIVRIDKIEKFDGIEGLIFFANPDILSGLTTWTFFDNNSDDSVVTKFGSGCSSIITQTVVENRNNGSRTFLGLLDPSARPFLESNILTFAIPMSRFETMYHTMRQSCLFDTHAWGKIRQRIESESEVDS